MPARPKPPPESLGVLGQSYTIQSLPADQLPEAYGLHWADDRRIEVRDSMSPFDLRDTTLHEVFHAIRAAQGREYGGETEEDYVRSLATGLTVVLRDNPAFAKWLINHPKRK
ncbi:hypothetical protein SAMN03159494_03594 [Achromobacter sp. NFACC18-2]|nr:hypothetical protein SAMN03159494_03594 [Achromobacter sp. NFACC18-2]